MAQQGAVQRAIGLMSGTSLDGVDAALIETDGERVVGTGPALTLPYDQQLRGQLRGVLGGTAPAAAIDAATLALTMAHAMAVELLLDAAELPREAIGLIGFHGQTILHAPQQRRTWQIGDGQLLARLTGIDVVCDFRSADVASGGEGAPLVPVYHAALAAELAKPLAVLNIGGVANLTYVGADGALIACDTGPGNAPLNDWVHRHNGAEFDRDGALAAAGHADTAIVARLLDHAYFARAAPKSLDRDAFDLSPVQALSPADGAATLTAFTVGAIAAALPLLPALPRQWLVTGGGRHNPTMMRLLARALRAPVAAVDDIGWDGDALEAQAFGFLAVRSRRGLPLSYPTTTGVPAPMQGGRFFAANGAP